MPNKVFYVNGDTTRGSYGSAVFNGSINLEKSINDKWKAGLLMEWDLQIYMILISLEQQQI